MRDVVREWLGGSRNEWNEKLTLVFGFSASEADWFIPAVLDRVVGAVSRGALDVPEGVSERSLLERIDVAELAQRTGLEPETARDGLEGLLPDVASLLRERGGGALDLD